MRILLFNWRSMQSRAAGGAETHCFEIFNRIARKNSVHLIASCDNKNNPKNGFIDKIQVSHVMTVEMLFPIFSLLILRKFSPKSFDVIVEDDSKFPMFWPLFVSKLFSKPFVMIVHHVHGKTLFEELPPVLGTLFYFLELFGLKFYSLFNLHVVVVSESTKNELVSLGFSEGKIKVIYNGLNLNPKPRHIVSKASYPLIVYFGRVKKYKRLDHLILAVRRVSGKVKNLKVVIAGKGDEKIYRELSELAKQQELGDVIQFVGEVSEDKKEETLQSAWVYAICSMKEGFGISVIEAQAFGTPVVAYDVPGIRDSVKHGFSGILVKDGDIDAFADALIKACINKSLREELSKGAAENAQNYDWGKSAKEFMELLKQIAS